MKLNATNKIVYKTSNYETFNFPDNFIYREAFYDYLKESISQKNLLIDCPILIDNNFNIVDGCYRVLVAKSLGIELFYRFTENKRIDHINIKDVRDKVLAEDYLTYYKDNINYRMLASELSKFEKLMPKKIFLRTMGVNSKSRTEFWAFKRGEYIFTEEREHLCKRIMNELEDYEWTKEAYKVLYFMYGHHNISSVPSQSPDLLAIIRKYDDSYIKKYKQLLSENKILPQFTALIRELEDYELYNVTSPNQIVKNNYIHNGLEYEYFITFETLILIEKLYQTSDILIQI